MSMMAVAESGSTKCDWLLDDGRGQVTETSTIGFNPFFHSTEEIIRHLRGNEVLMKHAQDLGAVYFYGSGCSSPDRNEVVLAALREVFPNAACSVSHDLNAAAFSTWTGEPGITCILGTGSNSCYYDGHAVSEVVPALGYILGDEGSGSWFGRHFLAEFLYHRLPADLEQAFTTEYGIGKEDILNAVYKQPGANVYLASFMKFLAPRSAHPWVRNLARQGLTRFAEIHIRCYDNYRHVPVHFVGSVAHFFRDVLQQVAGEQGFRIGVINRSPAMALLAYHKSRP